MNFLTQTNPLEKPYPTKLINNIAGVPRYALKSKHSTLTLYVIERKYNIKKPSLIVKPDTDITSYNKKIVSLYGCKEHAYGITYPIYRSNFIALDMVNTKPNIGKTIVTLMNIKIVKRIDVIMSSVNNNTIKYHIYAELNGTYNCYPLLEINHINICPGFFSFTVYNGESTIRISNKFFSTKLFRSTKPLTLLTGYRCKSGNFEFKDYRKFILNKLHVSEYTGKVTIKKEKKVNLRQ